ncbi:hypothetical protein MVES_002356 [Malassezia vespertilionis]|uniref:Xylanolytic transcriptional activator regulatory domain-containing protein n=2 Tax=Malassezia vespertilionis TaxID=2020962 RepID=A0A2N1JA10_9BASI|nr:hypothetical protein MVES_002356 [Malassezia vespertilionis]
MAEHKMSPDEAENGVAHRPLKATNLGMVAADPVRVLNREPRAEALSVTDTEAEDAAFVLEGLNMSSAMPLQEHRGGSVMQRAFGERGAAAGEELAREGFVDPMEGPKNTFSKCLERENSTNDEVQPGEDPVNQADAVLHNSMFGHDTGEACPVRTACLSQGLMKPSYMTESSLGWGLGWAFAAAEEMRRADVVKGRSLNSGDIPPANSGRLTVLCVIMHTLPTFEQALHLLDIFEARVLPFVHNIIHFPTFRKEVATFYALEDIVKQANAVDHVDTAWLGLLLMVFVKALRFRSNADAAREAALGRLTNPRNIHIWFSATMSCLVLGGFVGSSSMTVLQTILLMMFQCTHTANNSTSLLRIAIANAQSMGMHRLGDKAKQVSGASPEYTIRHEVAKRIWWSLVIADWQFSLECVSPSAIHPNAFNTPPPGNYNDTDLSESPLPLPSTGLTDMSYTLSTIELAKVTREHADIVSDLEMKGATEGTQPKMTCEQVSRLDEKYRTVLDSAPILTCTTSEVTEALEVQRWTLQHSIFNRLLSLHRAALSHKRARNCCVELARKALSMQKELRSRSDLGDKLIVNVLQSFSAAMLLCLDLLYSLPTAIQRQTIRTEITEGLDAMSRAAKDTGLQPRGICIIEILLEEEEKRWTLFQKDPQQFQSLDSVGRYRKTNLLNLALRVARMSRGKQETKPLPSDEANGVDVLPIWNAKRQPVSIQYAAPSNEWDAMQDPALGAFPPPQPTVMEKDLNVQEMGGFTHDFVTQDGEVNWQALMNSNISAPENGMPNYTLPQVGEQDLALLQQLQPNTSPSAGSASDQNNLYLPSLSHSSSPSENSRHQGNSMAVHMDAGPADGFWDWVLSQGLRPEAPFTGQQMPETTGQEAYPTLEDTMVNDPLSCTPQVDMDSFQDANTKTGSYVPGLTPIVAPVLPTQHVSANF